jgi:hypothetical protein
VSIIIAMSEFYAIHPTIAWIFIIASIFAGVIVTDPMTWKEIHIALEMRELRKALNDGMDHLKFGYRFRRDHERPEMIVVYDPQHQRRIFPEFAVSEVFSAEWDRRKKARKPWFH